MFRLSLKEFLYLLLCSLILSHFIISLGREESFFRLITSPLYWPDLAYVCCITIVVIYTIYLTHRWLDKKYPIHQQVGKRLIIQVLLTIVLPSLLSFILSFFYLRGILGYDIWKTSFMLYEYPVAILLIICLNLSLLFITVLNKVHPPVTSQARRTMFVFQKGERKALVEVSEIACIIKDGELPVVFTFDGRQFSLGETLDEISQSLDPAVFFRANRQAIIHFKIGEHYVVQRSGKIDLKLSSPVSREITISQKRAQDFKNWITSI